MSKLVHECIAQLSTQEVKSEVSFGDYLLSHLGSMDEDIYNVFPLTTDNDYV